MNTKDEELINIYQQGVNLSTNGQVKDIVEALELIVAEEMTILKFLTKILFQEMFFIEMKFEKINNEICMKYF